MYRRVVVSSTNTKTGPIDVLYHVRGASVVSQRKNTQGEFDPNVPIVEEQVPNVFYNAVRLRVSGAVTFKTSFEFILDVAENQPAEEAVEEIKGDGVVISVYNEHGVLVCRNTPKTLSTGVPGEEPGEMASEPIDGTGEMI